MSRGDRFSVLTPPSLRPFRAGSQVVMEGVGSADELDLESHSDGDL